MSTLFRHYIIPGIFTISLTFSCSGSKQKNILIQTPTKLQVCPDAWYINRMPAKQDSQNPPIEYMVIDGKRVEISEVDLNWIKKNCAITQPTPVY